MFKKIMFGIVCFLIFFIFWIIFNHITAYISWDRTSDDVLFTLSPIMSVIITFFIVKKFKI